MNGCMLLVLLVLAGQVAPGWPGESPSQIDDNTPVVSRDYGWQINPKTKVFEFIIQLSPDKVTEMWPAGGSRTRQEFFSEIHPEVAVRIRKVVVAIGTEPLTSISINEVRRLPPVLSAIDSNVQSEVGRGRFADLETSRPGEMFNVAGGAPPPSLPAGGIGTSLSDPSVVAENAAAGLLDALRDQGNLLAQNSADAFLNDARGTPNSSVGSKFSNTGQPATPNLPPSNIAGNLAGNAPSSQVPTLNPNAVNPNAVNPNAMTTPTLGGAGGLPAISGSTATPPGSAMPAFPTATPGFPNASANTGSFTTGPTASGNFGAPPRGTSMQPFNNAPPLGGQMGSYATNPVGGLPNQTLQNQPLQTQPMYPLQSDPPSYAPTRLADSRALPNTSGNDLMFNNPNLVGTNFGNNSLSDMPTDQPRNTQTSSSNRTVRTNDLSSSQLPEHNGMDNIVPIMFVLSLVVNVYLGMLIRKLLGRYRALLASVRSQTI